MSKRKLLALEYHGAETFNIYSQTDYRTLVMWLEDQKIRHYPIEDRASLRNIGDPHWEEAFHKYLDDLECLAPRNDPKSVLDWLLGLAAKLEYSDDPEKYQNATAENMKRNMQNAPRIVHANPLDNLNFESQEFKDGVKSVARLLKVTPHPDHLVTLQAVNEVIKENYSKQAINKHQSTKKQEGKPYALKESPLGFKTGDPVLDHAAKILRLLYIRDLRDLQTKINETIVGIQKITANPKTDTRLGKVGR